MKKHLLPLALLLLVAIPARAEEDDPEMRPRVLEMSRATVLASPGTPSALESFLPRGAKPEALTWPLPTKGSLLVLGLPGSDPVARRIADLFQFDVGPDALAGGYAVHAWQDGRRNLVFVFGADAAALQAARFEFDASAPVEMMDPNVRSLDFKKPNQEAGVQVLTGNRVVRPRYRMRALAPWEPLPDGIAMTVSGARGNRLWIDPAAGETHVRRQVRRARSLGVEPVIVLSKLEVSEAMPEALDAGGFPWLRDLSLRHFALEFAVDIVEVRSLGKLYAAWEATFAADVANVLRARGSLEELVVIPACYSDRLAKHYGPPPDLRGIPEAMIAWSGPLEDSTTISRTDAERRVKQAGVPVVLLARWAASFQEAPLRDLYIPSLPTGRAEDLGDVLAGVVVVGAYGTEAMLESAWDASARERFGLDLLTPLIPRDEKDTLELLRLCAVRLDHEAKENLGLVRWMAPLAAELRNTKSPVVRAPMIAASLKNDGHLDEKAWSSALRLPTGKQGVEVRLLSDGSALHIGVRLDRAVVRPAPFLMQLTVGAANRVDPWRFEISRESLAFHRVREPKVAVDWSGNLQMGRRVGPEGHGIEITLDRFALGGDAHELRCFQVGVSWGPANLWPRADKAGATGNLVVLE